MAIDTRVGSFLGPTAPGTVTFDTGLGTTPTALIFFVGPPDSPNTFHDDIDCGFGFCDSAKTQTGGGHWYPWSSDLSIGSTHTWLARTLAGSAIYIAKFQFTISGSDTIIIKGIVTGLNSDGTVDINFTNCTDVTARTIGFWAASEIESQVNVVTWNGSDVSVSTPFDPTVVAAAGWRGFGDQSLAYKGTIGNYDAGISAFTTPVEGGYVATPDGISPLNGFNDFQHGLATWLNTDATTGDRYETFPGVGGYVFKRVSASNTDPFPPPINFSCLAMAFDPTDFAQHVSERAPSTPNAIDSSLTAKAILGSCSDELFSGAYPGPTVNFYAVDLHGNAVSVWIGGQSNNAVHQGNPLNYGTVGSAIYTDGRVRELAHGTLVVDDFGNGNAPFEYSKASINASNPSFLTRDWTPGDWIFPTAVSPTHYDESGGFDGYPGFLRAMIIGPLKGPFTPAPISFSGVRFPKRRDVLRLH